MRPNLLGWVTAWTALGMIMATGYSSAQLSSGRLLNEIRRLIEIEEYDEVIALGSQAIEAEPDNSQLYFVRGYAHEAKGDYAGAIEDYDRVLELTPKLPAVLNRRGDLHFRLGHIEKSLRDFDKTIELVPKQAPYHWKRGISLYYAERYADGVRQFDLHQTVNANDVENAVWRFLCMARASGVGFERARREILPIQGDWRVPMKQIHRLYQGHGTIDEVFEAARSGDPSPQALKGRLFYAHLYVGLYHESAGNPKSARWHIKQAGDDYRIEDYMGDVARVHLKLRKGESEKKD